MKKNVRDPRLPYKPNKNDFSRHSGQILAKYQWKEGQHTYERNKIGSGITVHQISKTKLAVVSCAHNLLQFMEELK